jgi:hypothetical protein
LAAAVAVFSKNSSQSGSGWGLLGTNVLKLHKGIKEAESLLAIQQRTEANGMDTCLFPARALLVFSPLAAVAEDEN